MQSVHLPLSVRTEEEFRWAVGIVKSRSVVLDGQVTRNYFVHQSKFLHDIWEMGTTSDDVTVSKTYLVSTLFPLHTSLSPIFLIHSYFPPIPFPVSSSDD